MTASEAREPGSRLVEELRLLIDAIAERTGPWLDRVAANTYDEQLAARTLDRVADLVALLRAVLADRWEPGVPHMPGFTPTRKTQSAAPRDAGSRPRVQRIPVRRKEKHRDEEPTEHP